MFSLKFYHRSRCLLPRVSSETHNSGTPFFPVTPEQAYRRIYFEALDLIVSSIEERFDQPSFKAYSNMESLLIRAF